MNTPSADPIQARVERITSRWPRRVWTEIKRFIAWKEPLHGSALRRWRYLEKVVDGLSHKTNR
jgi:hypothetical protein